MSQSAIDAIEICDFRGFPADRVPAIKLGGSHLLLYGENGSGKSTIFEALAHLLDASNRQPFNADLSDASCLKHRFTNPNPPVGRVLLRFTTRDGTAPAAEMTWPIGGGKPTSHPFYGDLSRSRGFLDYRAVLQTHFVYRDARGINLFGMIVENLLRDVELPGGREATGTVWTNLQAAAEEWVALANRDPASMDDFEKADYPFGIAEAEDDGEAEGSDFDIQFREYVDAQERLLSEQIDRFNDALFALVREVERSANAYIATFDPVLTVEFDFAGRVRSPDLNSGAEWSQQPQLLLRARFRGELLQHPGTFLNEARLTAIAICFYLAALKAEVPEGFIATSSVRPLLVLDDVLIGLDMTHRLPLLDLVQKEFASKGWQVILLTFDREWYEVAIQRLPSKDWRRYELFAVRIGDYEQPLFVEDEDHLYRALRFLESGQIQAAAVHLRAEFELVLKDGCHKLSVKVPYHQDGAHIPASAFWRGIRDHVLTVSPPPSFARDAKGRVHWWQPADSEVRVVPPDLAKRVDFALRWVLNPLSHSQSIERYRSEIEGAVYAVDELKTAVKLAKSYTKAEPTVLRQLLLSILGTRLVEDK
jgi:energy-coupling factor transporter ATP-binding protein EcfA2